MEAEAELTSEQWQILVQRSSVAEKLNAAVRTLLLNFTAESGFTTASETLSTSHTPQTMYSVKNNVLITNPQMSKTVTESVV
jgi:hypothetical protein